jgi:hypothetical protein
VKNAALALLKTVPEGVITNLVVAAGLEFLSIIFGLLTHGAIASALGAEKRFDVAYYRPVWIMAIVHWGFFLPGLAILLYLAATY